MDLTLIIILLHSEFRSMEQPLHGLYQTENEVSMSVSAENKGSIKEALFCWCFNPIRAFTFLFGSGICSQDTNKQPVKLSFNILDVLQKARH